MKKLHSLILILIALAISGCGPFLWRAPAAAVGTWTKIPEAPEYRVEEPIPSKVGIIIFSHKPINKGYGIDVIEEWKEMRLFDSLVYPYQEGDSADAVMQLTITGNQDKNCDVNCFGAGILYISTFGLAASVVGDRATFTHNILAVINKSSIEVGRYAVKTVSTVRWGIADTTYKIGKYRGGETSQKREADSFYKGYKLQVKRIAFELAEKIRADRENLISKLGKSRDETSVP